MPPRGQRPLASCDFTRDPAVVLSTTAGLPYKPLHTRLPQGQPTFIDGHLAEDDNDRKTFSRQ